MPAFPDPRPHRQVRTSGGTNSQVWLGYYVDETISVNNPSNPPAMNYPNVTTTGRLLGAIRRYYDPSGRTEPEVSVPPENSLIPVPPNPGNVDRSKSGRYYENGGFGTQTFFGNQA